MGTYRPLYSLRVELFCFCRTLALRLKAGGVDLCRRRGLLFRQTAVNELTLLYDCDNAGVDASSDKVEAELCITDRLSSCSRIGRRCAPKMPTPWSCLPRYGRGGRIHPRNRRQKAYRQRLLFGKYPDDGENPCSRTERKTQDLHASFPCPAMQMGIPAGVPRWRQP